MSEPDALTRALIERVELARRVPAPTDARAIRMGAGVTQQEMADVLGVHRVTVARWESGDRTPRGRLVRARYVELLERLDVLPRVRGDV